MNSNLALNELFDSIEDKDMLFASKMNENDVFKSICGEDEYGNAKSMISIKLSDFDIQNEEENVLDEMILDNPIVNVFKTPALTMVDLTFTNPSDFDFVNTVSRMQSYILSDMRSINENVLSTIVLTIIPKEYLGEVYCTGIHGTFCIMPSKPDVPTDTIRFIFENTYFYSFKIPEEIEYTEEEYGTENDLDIENIN